MFAMIRQILHFWFTFFWDAKSCHLFINFHFDKTPSSMTSLVLDMLVDG